jgi:SAM-dependent methyltransferase
MTANNALLEWERAEVERSGVQARLSGNAIQPTHADIIARYATPPATASFAWEYAFHLLGDASGQRVLDLGCGDGGCTALVASHGGRVAALDISMDLLAMATRRMFLDGYGEAVTPLCGSAHAVPLASESVDIVFGMALLHHVDLGLVAKEVHRVLRRGGRAIFTEPIRNSKVLAAVRGLIPYRQPDVSPFERPLRFDEISAFASHFESWEHREFDLPLMQLLRVCEANPAWEALASKHEARMLRRFPQLRRFASIMVFQVRK